jgi:hypothetical protein
MNIKYGNTQSKRGHSIIIELDGAEVAEAIDAWIIGRGVYVSGERAVTVNGEICHTGQIYIFSPASLAVTPIGEKMPDLSPAPTKSEYPK